MQDEDSWEPSDEALTTRGWQRLVVLFLVTLLVAPVVIGALVVVVQAITG